MSKAIEEIVRFQIDRGLDKKEFDLLNEQTSIVEELLEANALDVSKSNRPLLKTMMKQFVEASLCIATPLEKTKHYIVDALCDVIVFDVGGLLKLGYNPEIALQEAAKEINSREGSMVDGKFEKDLSDGAKAKWYTADYDKARRV